MPLDPFFTSASKDEFHEEKQRKKALAKAVQFKIGTARYTRRHIHHCLNKHLEGVDSAKNCAKALHDSLTQVRGGRALRGFKAPKKLWKHRNSQNTNGDENCQHE